MPLYEYDCPGCGQPFEKRVRMSQADETPCPNCGGTHTKRKLSRISVRGHTATASAPAPASGGL